MLKGHVPMRVSPSHTSYIRNVIHTELGDRACIQCDPRFLPVVCSEINWVKIFEGEAMVEGKILKVLQCFDYSQYSHL